MKYYTLALFFFAFQFAIAENTPPVLQNLCNVNAEWKNQPEARAIAASNPGLSNPTYHDWIATHLRLVEKALRTRDVSALSPAQQENRSILLNQLNGYWKNGVFPVNDYVGYKTPVFIDRIGTHCAVGYLMMQSGSDDLAQGINTNEKFAYVHEIKTNGVKEWADKNGFTIDELAWIQPGYPTTIQSFDMDSGLNGTVNVIVPDSSGQAVYVGGSFSKTTGGTVCNNIAVWMSGFAGWDWVPVGSGLNGAVHAMFLKDNKLYVGGEFTMAGSTTTNHIAVYDISLGQWQAVGSLDSTVYALAFYKGSLYAGGKFTGFVSKWTGNQWQDITQGFIYGEGVRTMEVWNGELVIGGSFELATGAYRTHVTTYDGTYMGTLGFGTRTPVNDLAIHNGQLFAACDVVHGNDTCAIAVYDTSVANPGWKIKLKPTMDLASFFQGKAIKSLISESGHLIAGGDFLSGAGMTYGNNLMELADMPSGWGDSTQLACYPMAVTDTTVKTVASLNTVLYFGGNFINNLGTPLNHVAYTTLTPTGIRSFGGEKAEILVFPNPATTTLNLKSSTPVLKTVVLDVAGRNVLEQPEGPASQSIDISHLQPGVYMLRVFTQNGAGTTRFIKQ